MLRLARGALAERGERDLRAAVLEDVAPGLGFPQSEPLGFFAERRERGLLLRVTEIVRVHGGEVRAVVAQVPGPAGRQEVQACEVRGVRIAETSHDLGAELHLVATRDDGDVDRAQERQEQVGDPRVDQALGRGERVIEVESDEGGRGHGVSSLEGGR
nr:hypothetical protein [Microbacterium barkeri]